MSYPEFKNAVESMGRKLNWQLKLALAPLSPSFKEDDFPLSDKFDDTNDNQVFRMSDAMMLKNMAEGK